MLATALGHPRTPWYAKAWLLLVIAYAVSPVDLIPDPIPVLGYLDDAILLPLGILLVLRMIPADVLAECRSAPQPPILASRRLRITGMVLVVSAWLALAAVAWRALRALAS